MTYSYFIFSLLKISLCSLFLGLVLHPMWKSRNQMKIFRCKMQYWMLPVFLAIGYFSVIVQGQGNEKLKDISLGSAALLVLVLISVLLIYFIYLNSASTVFVGRVICWFLLNITNYLHCRNVPQLWWGWRPHQWLSIVILWQLVKQLILNLFLFSLCKFNE